MKTDTSFQSAFLFNPEMSLTAAWPTARRSKPRFVARPVVFVPETQISYKQELICDVILMFCLLFSLAAFVAQFALA